jgi:outer membrane lipoprotein-sorting protein
MFRKFLIMIFVSSFFIALQISAQTVDEIIAKNIEARGGMEKIKAVKSLKMTGLMTARGQVMPFSVQMERPNSVRVEFTFQGKAVIQAYDGENGWKVMPFVGTPGPTKMTERDLRDIEEQADLDGPLVDYKSKGHSVEFLGKEDLEGVQVYKLKLTLKNGNVRTIDVNSSTNLELETSSKQMNQGQEIEVDAFLRDYKDTDGLMMPYSIEQKVAGETVSSFTVEKVEMNVDLDDALFKMPGENAQSQTMPSQNSPVISRSFAQSILSDKCITNRIKVPCANLAKQLLSLRMLIGSIQYQGQLIFVVDVCEIRFPVILNRFRIVLL